MNSRRNEMKYKANTTRKPICLGGTLDGRGISRGLTSEPFAYTAPEIDIHNWKWRGRMT
jgi:hypothetical protein